MLVAVDFDGVIVRKDRPFADVMTPFQLMPHAKEGLKSLKAAGHTVLLYSARANRTLLYTPEWDPLVRAGVKRPHAATLEQAKGLNWARYQQMIKFVDEQLSGLIDAVDDGLQGKPLADLFIDDRAFGFQANGWLELAHLYGAPEGQE